MKLVSTPQKTELQCVAELKLNIYLLVLSEKDFAFIDNNTTWRQWGGQFSHQNLLFITSHLVAL